MLHLSEKVKITVFLVSAVILGSAATKHPNQRVTFVPKNVKRESPVGNHFGGGFGQHGHQQFQLQALSSHQGLDGHQGSHFVMPQFSFAAPQLHSSGHQNLAQGHNFAHGGGAGQFSQLAKILTTQGQVGHGGHGGGGFGGAGFGHSFAVGGLKTAPMTFAVAPSTSYGTPASGHFAQVGGAHSAGLAGHGFGGSLQGLNLGSLGHSLGNLGGGHGVAFKGGDFGAGALSGGNYLLGQNYAPSFNAHQLTALPQASSAQTVPAYAVGIKGLGHYSSGGHSQGGLQSHGDLGSQASLGHGLTFDASKYNIQTLSHGKTLAPVAYASPAASNVRHTSISNLDTKNSFKPSVLLGMYADVSNSGESHGFGGQSLGGHSLGGQSLGGQSFSNLKFSQASLPAYSGHGGQSFDSGASYGAGYNTINYSEGAGH